MDLANLPLVVEPMCLVHVPAVMEIERESFALPWPESAYHHELTQNEMAHYYVLGPRLSSSAPDRSSAWRRLWRTLSHRPDSDARAIVWGYGGFWMMYDEAHISTLAVRTGWRRQGLGELLLLVLLDEAHRLGARLATLEVRVSNVAAQVLYFKYGFKQAGQRKGYYSDNREDALILTTPELASPDYQALINARRSDLLRRLAHKTFSTAECAKDAKKNRKLTTAL
jgi:ribosomal-protein-alanine N-acetyltransferase